MTPKFKIEQWEEKTSQDWWRWAVWIEGLDEDLDLIDFVEWTLHPTFPNPVRKVFDRDSKFRLATGGWAGFYITAKLQLKDGNFEKLTRLLTLNP
jgi:transcription initiation factor IIF auxiliary subunit